MPGIVAHRPHSILVMYVALQLAANAAANVVVQVLLPRGHPPQADSAINSSTHTETARISPTFGDDDAAVDRAGMAAISDEGFDVWERVGSLWRLSLSHEIVLTLITVLMLLRHQSFRQPSSDEDRRREPLEFQVKSLILSMWLRKDANSRYPRISVVDSSNGLT
eukprot:753865-Hanusia_phi.AAC.4